MESERTRKLAKEARARHKERLRGRRRSGRSDASGHPLREIPIGAYYTYRINERWPDGEVKYVTLARTDHDAPTTVRGKTITVTPAQYQTALVVRKVRPTLVAEYANLTVFYLPEKEWRRLRTALTSYDLTVKTAKPRTRRDVAPTAEQFNARIEAKQKRQSRSAGTATNVLARVSGQKFHSFAELRNALK